MRLYHATSAEAARAILREGFHDSRPHWGFQHELGINGVWLASRPVDENEGAQSGDAQLVVEIPGDVVAEYELVEEATPGSPEPPPLPPGVEPSRTWLIPAEVLNRYPIELVA